MDRPAASDEEAQIRAWRLFGRIMWTGWYLGWAVGLGMVAWDRPLLGGILALLAIGQQILIWRTDGFDKSWPRVAKLEEEVDQRFQRVREALDKDHKSLASWAGELGRKIDAIEARLPPPAPLAEPKGKPE